MPKKSVPRKKGVMPEQLEVWNKFVDAVIEKTGVSRSEAMKMAKEPYQKWKKSQGL